MDDNYLMVCAIDLGTTGSGYAFAFKNDETIIYMNKNWGEGHGCTTYKTPTSVLTGQDGQCEAFGYDAYEKYNEYQRGGKQDYNLFENFKMILHRTSDWDEKVTVTSLTGNPMPALDIFAFMIKELKKHCIQAVKKQTIEFNEDMILWVLTVPSIWTETAKDFMREVAFKAGLIKTKDSGLLILALEPEAAALCCKQIKVKMFGNQAENTLFLKKGEKYLVIDAGGGTIDITAHEVEGGLKLKELTTANGGDWGGTAVDKKFKELLIKIFGKEFISAFEKTTLYTLMNTFELDKKRLKNDSSETFKIEVTFYMSNLYRKVYGEDTDVLFKKQIENVKFDYLKGTITINNPYNILFKDTIETITAHVTNVFKDPKLKGLSYVMLVGGFGESPILQQAIQDIIPKESKLIVPFEAQLCVMKGAVYFGFHLDEITQRITKKSYGTDVSKDRYFDPYVIKGQSIEYGQKIVKQYFPVTSSQTKVGCDIYSTDVVDFTQQLPVSDKRVFKVGTCEISVPREGFFLKVIVVFSWSFNLVVQK